MIYFTYNIFYFRWNLPESKWANPYKLKNFNNNRDVVIEMYKKYLDDRKDLIKDLHELKGKR